MSTFRLGRISLRTMAPVIWVGALAACGLLWAFWPTLADLATRWGQESQYGHGFLVPLFSLYLVWTRRDLLGPEALSPSWWGLPVLAAGLGLRFLGSYLFFDWLAAMALLPCLAGLVLLVGGSRALRCAWPAIAFLAFMVPLPHRVAVGLGGPLQRIATLTSTFILQTLGFVTFSEGNVILLGEHRIGVVEACSGLSMLVVFFALATAVVLLVRRSPLEKCALLLSAIPIALAANITRIVVTAILYETTGKELADLVFHDLAGWLMMPLALVMLWVELRLMAWVLIPAPVQEEKYLNFGSQVRKESTVPAPKPAAKELRKAPAFVLKS